MNMNCRTIILVGVVSIFSGCAVYRNQQHELSTQRQDKISPGFKDIFLRIMYPEHDETYSYRRAFPVGWIISQVQKQAWVEWAGGEWRDKGRIEFRYASQDSLTVSYLDYPMSRWLPYEQTVYSFDADGNIKSELDLSRVGEELMNKTKDEYTYDSAGNEAGIYGQRWQGNLWVDGNRTVFTSNEDRKITRWLTHVFNEGWLDSLQYLYTYDKQGHALQMLHQTACAKLDSGRWRNVEKYTYKVDSVGKRTEELFEGWDADRWTPHWRHTMRYDSFGRIIDNVEEECKQGQWNNSIRTAYSYDSIENVTETEYRWGLSKWGTFSRKTFTYGEDGILIQVLFQWFEENSWVNSSRDVYIWKRMDKKRGISLN